MSGNNDNGAELVSLPFLCIYSLCSRTDLVCDTVIFYFCEESITYVHIICVYVRFHGITSKFRIIYLLVIIYLKTVFFV
jgi:hypothetical protein